MKYIVVIGAFCFVVTDDDSLGALTIVVIELDEVNGIVGFSEVILVVALVGNEFVVMTGVGREMVVADVDPIVVI